MRRVDALALERPEPPFEERDAGTCEAAVGLELALARAARADPAAEPLEVLPHAAHAREVVLELRELDLELALGAPRVLGEDVEDQLRPVDDAGAEGVLERSLLRRARARRRRAAPPRPPCRRPASARRACPCPTNVRGSGARAVLRQPRRRARRPQCARARAAQRARRRRRRPSGRRRRGARAPAPPQVRDRAGAQSPRDYAAVRCAPVTALADRLAARTLELVEHSVHERARGCDSRAPPRARPVRVVPSTRATRRSCSPRSGGPSSRSSCSCAHYDTVPAQGNLPGRIADGAVHGLGASDMKGGLAVALELVARLGTTPRRRTTSRSSSSAARSCRRSTIRSPRSSRARRSCTRLRSRSCSSRPTSPIQAGCLGQRRGRAHVPRDERPLGAAVARRQRDRAGGRGLASVSRLEPRVAVVAGLEFHEVVSVTRLDAGIADNVIPGEATATLNLRYPPDRDAGGAEAYLACARSRGRDARDREQRAAGRVVHDSPLVRALQRRGRRSGSSRSRRGRTSRTSPRAASTRSTSGRGTRRYAHSRDELVRIDALVSRVRGPRSLPRAARCGEDVRDGPWNSASRSSGTPGRLDAGPIEEAIALLDRGELRVAERSDGGVASSTSG